MRKNALRALIIRQKEAMSEAEITARSAALSQRLFDSPLYRQASSLYTYVAVNQEVRTAPIIRRAWADGKRVAVPKVLGREMVFIWLDDLDSLSPRGRFGIPEPVSDGPVAGDESALIVVPGLAFDPAGHRVGYGGGYYDRYLALHPRHPTVALCYAFQLLGHLPTQAHDCPVDLVIHDSPLQGAPAPARE